MNKTINNSIVYLVGAGPGDAGLITVKGKECLEAADVVVYDYLANISLLDYCKPEVEKIFVGKRSGSHTLTQDKINELLVNKAIDGKVIVRLKGGDPFIFGRGGEEALFLMQHNVKFEVVPGVTAGLAVPAYAGIPFTQRGVASSVTFLTGHDTTDNLDEKFNWQQLAKGVDTLVIYMGVSNIGHISKRLIENGRSEKTPVCLIRWGTYNHQESVTGTLNDIADKVIYANFKAPAITVIGDVVKFKNDLDWFTTRPLFGKRIMVTRSRDQQSKLKLTLERYGATVIEFPTVEIKPINDFSIIDDAINKINRYNWLVLTSVNAVDSFFKRVKDLGFDSRILSSLKVAVIGDATRKSLLKYGVVADLMPSEYTANGLSDALGKSDINFIGTKVLFPTSQLVGKEVADRLESLGAEVDTIYAYANECPTFEKAELDFLVDKSPDMITFTSSSTVNNFVRILGEHHLVDVIKKIPIATIGPVTTDTVEKLDASVATQASQFTIDGMVEAILEYFRL